MTKLNVSPIFLDSPLNAMSAVKQNGKKYLVDTGSAALLFWDDNTQHKKNVSCNSNEQELSYVGDVVCVRSETNEDFNIQGAYVTQMSFDHATLLGPLDGILGLLPPKKEQFCTLAVNTNGVAKDLNCPEFYNVQLKLDPDRNGHLDYKCTTEKLKDGHSMTDNSYLNACVRHAIVELPEGDTLFDSGWPTNENKCIDTNEKRHNLDCETNDCSYGVTPRVCTHDTFVGNTITMQFSDTGGTIK